MSSVKANRRSKRISKLTNIEIKQEPVVKEEPNVDGDVISVSRPADDGISHAIASGSTSTAHDFNEIKKEIKCEEEDTDNKEDSVNSDVIKEEIKEELVVKDEPNDNVDIELRPRVDGYYQTNYDKSSELAHGFIKLKDEIKCKEEEMVKEMEPVSFTRSDENKRSANRATSVGRSSDSDEASYSPEDDSTEAAQGKQLKDDTLNRWSN